MEQPVDVQSWLTKEFAARLADAVGDITGERPQTQASIEASEATDPPPEGELCWRQPFGGISGAMWIVADQDSWRNIGSCATHPATPATTIAAIDAGIDDALAEQIKAAYLEIVRQTAGSLARLLTETFDSAPTPVEGAITEAVGEANWSAIEAPLSGVMARIRVGFEPELLVELAMLASQRLELPTATACEQPPDPSMTFDLLLDVELPVSISFGRAQVPLKDVLKLTVGSIVELNRAIGDPVEVIVNNCVIARGEVVVVQGNFGVRIQNVISTQERLRTLD
jgi:flagellar motor switch protein FliN/FliY